MKKILALILVFALVFTSAISAFALSAGKYSTSQTSSLKTIQFVTEYDDGEANVKVVGRTNPENPLLFGIHGSGVEFNVTGTEVVGVRIQSYNNSHTPIPLYFEINGEQVVIEGAESTTQGTYDYIIKNDLDVNTTYNVKVLQDQESWAQYKYHGFYITHAVVDSKDSAKIAKADDGDYKIIVLGDSISSARNIGGVHLSYHQIMAKNLNADIQVLSAGGGLFGKGYKKSADGSIESDWQIRIAKDWNAIAWENSEYKMPEMYDADGVEGRDKYETDPTHVNFQADLVFLNIGTNDYNKGYLGASNPYIDYNTALFKQQFYAMLDEMLGVGEFEGKGYYPDATVMLACNLMSVGQYLKDFYAEVVAEYLADRPELGKNANGKDRVSVYIFKECASNGGIIGSRWDDLTNQQVYDQHPNATAHAIAGDYLTDDIAEYMGWKRKSQDVAYPNNDGILETFPEIERKENELFLGFTDDDDSYIKKGGQIAWGSYIYSKYLEVNLGGKVVTEINPNDPKPVDTKATYTNGFYIQGAQIRVGLTPEDKATGLRFIVVNNTEIKTALQNAIAGNLNYERGLMVISGSKYQGGQLEIDTANASKVPAINIFASTTTLQANYDKYTACIVKIPPEHFTTKVVVRPYFKYTDNSGVEHVYYGEQYSCSLFTAARLAYGNESDAVNEYLYNTIISKCTGDNDTTLPF